MQSLTTTFHDIKDSCVREKQNQGAFCNFAQRKIKAKHIISIFKFLQFWKKKKKRSVRRELHTMVNGIFLSLLDDLQSITDFHNSIGL